MEKLPTDMARVVVCTEKDIDEISSQINQELREENEKLKYEIRLLNLELKAEREGIDKKG